MFNKIMLGTKQADFLATKCTNKSAMLVLVKFIFLANKRNMVVGTPKDIAKRSNITMWDFNAGVKALKEHDCVRKYSKREYMVSPDIVYNGDENQLYFIKHLWENQTSRGLKG